MTQTVSNETSACGCSGSATIDECPTSHIASDTQAPDLADLVPIAVVIAAGCEPCARRMVERALRQGSAPRHIHKTVALVAHLQQQDCVLEAIGQEAIDRMTKPLAMARATLDRHR